MKQTRQLDSWTMGTNPARKFSSRQRIYWHLNLQPALDALPETALHWPADGSHRPGHPKETWMQMCKGKLKECGLTWWTITRRTSDRQWWHSLVEAFLCHPGCREHWVSDWLTTNLNHMHKRCKQMMVKKVNDNMKRKKPTKHIHRNDVK